MKNPKDHKEEVSGRAKGGKARASKMTLEEKKAASLKMVKAKAEIASLPKVMAGSKDCSGIVNLAT